MGKGDIMSRPKPAQPDVIKGIIDRIDLLLKNGIVQKDFVITTEEAAAITGLSPETIRQYGKMEHFPAFKYPGKNLYPGKEIAEWVLKHYHGVKLETTAQINGYKPGAVKRGRPRKGVSA
jgi:hypothetical protein